jgi:anaerobic magnesium-protoporphyrin IX monomethyl ester cyclase
MKVGLLYPAWTGAYGVFGHFAKRASIWPPLNLALLGAIAERHGHEVVIIDGEAESLSMDQMVERARATGADVFGLTAFTPFFHINVALAEAMKKAGITAPIAVGGPHITIMESKAFLPAFDYAFVGEAEESWPAFLERLEKKQSLADVKGLLYRDNDQVLSTGHPESMQDPDGKGYPLDQFPLPARHLLPMHLYKLGTLKGVLPMTSIQTTRGCPWKCIFCASDKLQTTRVIRRSPRSIVEEMKTVVERFGTRHFYIVDDVLTLHPKHVLEIADGIEAAGIKITFEGSTRANLVDDETIKRLAEVGLIRLSFGLETVDSEMRKTMKKKVPLEHYERANRICNKYGVEALNSVMIGLPGETRDTVKATLKWLRAAREVKQANFAIAVPYPGTEFHDIAAGGQHGVELMTDDFSNYRRYGSAVTKVGDLTPEDLIELQNEGFVSIYSAPWRWVPMLRKHGLMGGSLMLLRVAKVVASRVLPKSKRRQEALFSPGDGSVVAMPDAPGVSETSAAARLVQLKKKQPAPAGHYGDPKSPNAL